jgi:hypothetical protein
MRTRDSRYCWGWRERLGWHCCWDKWLLDARSGGRVRRVEIWYCCCLWLLGGEQWSWNCRTTETLSIWCWSWLRLQPSKKKHTIWRSGNNLHKKVTLNFSVNILTHKTTNDLGKKLYFLNLKMCDTLSVFWHFLLLPHQHGMVCTAHYTTAICCWGVLCIMWTTTPALWNHFMNSIWSRRIFLVHHSRWRSKEWHGVSTNWIHGSFYWIDSTGNW